MSLPRDSSPTLEALDLLEYENSPEVEREATIQAIKEGLDDMHAGRTRSHEDFDREFRERHGLSPRSPVETPVSPDETEG